MNQALQHKDETAQVKKLVSPNPGRAEGLRLADTLPYDLAKSSAY